MGQEQWHMAAFNKTGGLVTLSVADALEEALCHGWMDGQIKYVNERSCKSILPVVCQEVNGHQKTRSCQIRNSYLPGCF